MSNNPKKKNKGGRPRIEFSESTWDQINKMCAIACTQEEIASVLGCSIDTIEARIKEKHGVSFPEYFKRYVGQGKTSLRRKQYEIAMKGNVSMCIWLGKQWLGQTDKNEDVINIYESQTVEHLEDQYAELIKRKAIRNTETTALREAN